MVRRVVAVVAIVIAVVGAIVRARMSRPGVGCLGEEEYDGEPLGI